MISEARKKSSVALLNPQTQNDPNLWRHTESKSEVPVLVLGPKCFSHVHLHGLLPSHIAGQFCGLAIWYKCVHGIVHTKWLTDCKSTDYLTSQKLKCRLIPRVLLQPSEGSFSDTDVHINTSGCILKLPALE